MESQPGPVGKAILKREWGCIDLSSFATTTLDSLCAVCSQVDLQRLGQGHCASHDTHYHLGSIYFILRKKTCPLCRLISSVFNNFVSRSQSSKLPSSSHLPEDPLLCMLRTKLIGHFQGPLNNSLGPELFMDQLSNQDRTKKVTNFAIEVNFVEGSSSTDDRGREEVHVIQQSIDNAASEETREVGQYHNDPDISTACKSRGRALSARQVDFNLIRQWLRLCENIHGEACQGYFNQRGSEEACKIRLIDVKNLQIIDGSTENRYIALSYVWGPGEQMSLTTQNHSELAKPHGISREKLPRNISNSIEVAINIQERYLWVDRLCILQDDQRDKVEQMSNMGKIYSCSTLTIISGSACCANGPLPGVEPNSRGYIQRSETVKGIRYITGQPDLAIALRGLTWCTRSWTFQEGFLSSRCLVFTDYQAYFRCMCEAWCEDSCMEGRMMTNPSLGNAVCHLDKLATITHIEKCAFYQYADIVEGFSSRKLTQQSDALWAFKGVAKVLESIFSAGFIWGMPSQNLDGAMLWRSRDVLASSRIGPHTFIIDSNMMSLPFPSWSWITSNGTATHISKCEDFIKGLVEWHPPLKYMVDLEDPHSRPWQIVEDDRNDDSIGVKPKGVPHPILNEHELGTIRFSTFSAIFNLELHTFVETHRVDHEGCLCFKQSLPCLIRQIDTDVIVGSMWVPTSWMGPHQIKTGEFCLLSLQVDEEPKENGICVKIRTSEDEFTKDVFDHADDCEHQAQFNIMLIDWKDGPYSKVATRVNITQIHRDDWLQASVEWGMVVLT